jgi:hypothetical protein
MRRFVLLVAIAVVASVAFTMIAKRLCGDCRCDQTT